METPNTKTGWALFLQIGVVALGIGTLGLMLGEPHLEGRNAHATTFEIYFKDPFLAYAYVGSIPFFVALFRAFRILADVRQSGAFSPETVGGLRFIKHCAFTLIGFVVGGMVFILFFGDKEDRPPGIFMSFLAILAAGVIAATAAMCERNLRNALGRPET